MITCYEDYIRTIPKINSASEFHGADLYGEIDEFRKTDHDRYHRYLKKMHKDFVKNN